MSNSLTKPLPVYSKGEEYFNSISHYSGILIGIWVIVSTLLCRVDVLKTTSGMIFGLSLIVLYAMSGSYHGLNPKHLKAKNVLRIIDHCTIFILIAGSYTPFILDVLMPENFAMGLFYLIFIWVISVVGITLLAVDMNRFKALCFVFYLLMGWSIIIEIRTIYAALGYDGFLLLLSGGIAYTVGFIFYVLGKKMKWMHSVFHVFVLLGSVLQALCFLNYVL